MRGLSTCSTQAPGAAKRPGRQPTEAAVLPYSWASLAVAGASGGWTGAALSLLALSTVPGRRAMLPGCLCNWGTGALHRQVGASPSWPPPSTFRPSKAWHGAASAHTTQRTRALQEGWALLRAT
jgi:hypothetical protein